MPRPTPYIIKDPAQVRVLASPVRQEIVDALAAAGPSPVATLATLLGRAPDALYFHLKRLLATGLVVERGEARRGRHVAAVYDVPGRPMTIRYGGAVGALPVGRVIASAVRTADREFARGLITPGATTEGPHRTLWGGRFTGWLGRAELAEANRLITRLSRVLGSGKPGRGRRPVSFTFVLAPARPRRTGKGASR